MNPENADSRLTRAVTLTATSIGFVVVQLDVTIVNVALKAISASLGGDVSTLQWVVNAYTIVFASFILTAGTAGDIFGAKRIFIAGFIVFVIASLLCGISPSLGALVAARALQGFGGAMLLPCSLMLLNHTYQTEKERMSAVGIWAAGASVALASGPVIGGLLVTAIGWRSIFFINLPLGLIGIWLTMKYTKETTRADIHRIDYLGQALAIFCLADLAWANIEGGVMGWTHWPVITAFVLFAIAGALFILVETKAKDPMLPLSLFHRSTFSIPASIGLLVNIAFYGLIFVLSLFLQQQKGYTALQTGLAFLPMTAIVLISNLSAGRISARFGIRMLILCGQILAIAGSGTLLGMTSATPYSHMALPFLCIGGGLGLIVPAITAGILGSVEKKRSGVAAGVLNSSRQAGSVIGVALLGSFIAQKDAFEHGLHMVLILCCVSFIATFLLALRMPSRTGIG